MTLHYPLDIHTHRAASPTTICNCYPQAFHPQPGCWYSVGVHPYSVPADPLGRELVCHPQVVAIGEAGLDKSIATPLTEQLAAFEQQARLAEEVGKPLIIHLVRAVDELLRLQKTLRPVQPWVIHGFRGKRELAEQLLGKGFYLSVGERFNPEALRILPIHRLLLETDESEQPIAAIYRQVAMCRGCAVETLQEAVQANVKSLFFKR